MSITDHQIIETAAEIGAGMARTLGMAPEEDMTTLREGQASHDGYRNRNRCR